MVIRCGRLVWLLLAVASASGAHADTPCRARVLIEPARAYVGQQLVYRLRIERREDVSQVQFNDSLSFPSFRVEWLHGQVPDPAIAGIGEHRIVAEERRALFPVRAGTLAIPASRIACTTPRGVIEAVVPGADVVVEALPAPEEGRVVGRVAVVARLERDAIALGESVALHVQIHGEANVWDAPLALAADSIPDVEILARDPKLERESGRRLLLTRTQIFDLVPRAAGRIEVPRVRVRWLDPSSGRWEASMSMPLTLTVAPAAPLESPPSAAPRPRVAAGRDGIAWQRIAAVALGAAGGVWLARAALRRRRRGLAAALAAAPHLAAATRANASGDPVATSRALAAALRAAIESRMPGANALAAEEIVQRSTGPLRAAAEALADLDRARFANSSPPAPDPDRIHSLISTL